MIMSDKPKVSLSPFEYSTPAGVPQGEADYFTDMDFDTAYQLMTNDASEGPRTPDAVFDDPYRSFEYHRNQILKGQTAGGMSPRMQFGSPGVSPNTRSLLHSINNISTRNAQFALSDSGYELLSITETSALEQFLDSIVDDTKLSLLSKHWPSIDPLAAEKIAKLQPPLKLQSHAMNRKAVSLPKHHMVSTTPSNPATAVPSGAASPKKSVNGAVKLEEISLQDAAVLAEEKQEQMKRPRKKSLLTSDERRLHHTTSEQKRRMVIREAYDVLVALVSNEEAIAVPEPRATKRRKTEKRAMSKSVVMNRAVEEIRALVSINSQLRRLIDK